MYGTKTKIKKERVIAGSVSGRKTKPDETGRGRNEGNRLGLIHGGKGEPLFFQLLEIRQGLINFSYYLCLISLDNMKFNKNEN